MLTVQYRRYYQKLLKFRWLTQCPMQVGMDVQRLDITGVEVTFREVGSAMSSRWETYVKGCSCLMVVYSSPKLKVIF